MEEFRVRAYETDPSGELRLITLVNYLEEAAWRNAHTLGFSVDHLLKKGVSWVMQRLKLDVIQWPQHNDLVYVDTWPSGLDRILTYRDFKIYNDQRELIATAKTNWIVLDIETRRMIRIPEFIKEARFSIERDNLPLLSEKITKSGELEQLLKYQVLERDIDRNGHVNNANYFQWCMEGPSDQMKLNSLRSIDMIFKTEALHGDGLVFHRADLGNGNYQHVITNSRTDKDVILAKTTFQTTV
ncbi:MAG: thioesterase [Cyclobacteriaceae bacterium]